MDIDYMSFSLIVGVLIVALVFLYNAISEKENVRLGESDDNFTVRFEFSDGTIQGLRGPSPNF